MVHAQIDVMCAAIAQLVEQGTENPCVLGSIPSCGKFFCATHVDALQAKKQLLQAFCQN